VPQAGMVGSVSERLLIRAEFEGYGQGKRGRNR